MQEEKTKRTGITDAFCFMCYVLLCILLLLLCTGFFCQYIQEDFNPYEIQYLII